MVRCILHRGRILHASCSPTSVLLLRGTHYVLQEPKAPTVGFSVPPGTKKKAIMDVCEQDSFSPRPRPPLSICQSNSVWVSSLLSRTLSRTHLFPLTFALLFFGRRRRRRGGGRSLDNAPCRSRFSWEARDLHNTQHTTRESHVSTGRVLPKNKNNAEYQYRHKRLQLLNIHMEAKKFGPNNPNFHKNYH
jgi:hypothetical protein